MIEWILNNKEWFFQGLGVFILSTFLGLIPIVRRRSRVHQGQVVFTGKHEWAWQEKQHVVEIFYPQPFDYAPNLTIDFPKQEDSHMVVSRYGGWINYGSNPPKPIYTLRQQHPEGFVIEIKSLGYYKPFFKWKAEGVIGQKR
jgi:hypothetical protein